MFVTGAVGLISAVVLCYFLYYRSVLGKVQYSTVQYSTVQYSTVSSAGLRVLSLNVWGMPAAVGAKDKELRISAIGDFVQKAEYDLYLFSEVTL